MKSFSSEIVPYGGWARNLRLSNGEIELTVTLEVGPRVVRLGCVGGPNLFGEFPEQLGKSGETRWMLRGGHRLWLAPENKPFTYEPDNGPVRFEALPDGARLVQEPGPLTGLRKTIEIRLDGIQRNRVRVSHTLANEGRAPMECSAWALSVMAQRGLGIVPLPPLVPHDERTSPNQNWSLWSYTDLADPRWQFGTRFVLLRQDPARGPTKLGMAQREGWVACALDGHLFVKRFRMLEDSPYPDHGINFEIYADERILELETMGPLVTLKPGQRASHEEEWVVFKDMPRVVNEADVIRSVLPLVQAVPQV